MRKTILIAAAFFISVTNCYAKITYFACDIDEGGGNSKHMDLAYDDQAGTVSYDVPAAGIRRHDPASVTPDTLNFTAGGILNHSINRVSLAIVETSKYSPDKSSNGMCSIVKAAAGAQF